MNSCKRAAGLVVAMAAVAAIATGIAATTTPVTGGMRLIPGGTFRPLYSDGVESDRGTGKISLAAFYLDAQAVTNDAFLEFVRTHPKWRKSRVKRIFADRNYLAHWPGDLSLGPGTETAPVVNVSWFAAKAFCRAAGGTLPTTAQWEYAAVASETATDASGDPDFIARILAWYSLPRGHKDGIARFENVYGVYDLHGSVWEWVLDFNSALTSGESRADSSRDRQLYCAAGVVGAASYVDYPSFLRHGYRSSLDGRYTHGELGFRCAAASPPDGVGT